MITFLAATVFGGSIVVTVIVLLLAVILYFLPVIVAYKRQHPYIIFILLLDLFLGWSLLGWAVAMVWSFIDVIDKETGIKITFHNRNKKSDPGAD